MKKFYKYPDIERLGSEDTKDILAFSEDLIWIEEKVDGGNGSFWLDEETGLIYEGSRNRNLTTDKDAKSFATQRAYLKSLLDGKTLNPDYIYHIEWMAVHTIRYTNIPPVVGYDIRLKHANNCEGMGMFLGREIREQEFNRLGVENVPLVWKGTVGELKKLDVLSLIPKSKYYDGWAEGIVLKNYSRKASTGNHQLFAKVVRAEFKEANKAVFGGIRHKITDTSRICDQYCTDARIIKAIHALTQEQGLPLKMELMKELPRYVVKDILKEEATEIAFAYNFLDFKEMKHTTSSRCARVLGEFLSKKGAGKE